jgi:hypothetical protein
MVPCAVRNLRIREDTAKYLRNLDPDSAYYDPKTRSMRENPLPGTNPEEVAYAGDNYYRCAHIHTYTYTHIHMMGQLEASGTSRGGRVRAVEERARRPLMCGWDVS